MRMERDAVKSSYVESVGYDPETHTLEVRYLDGGLCRYLQVPPMVFDELMAADSKGEYVTQYIKGSYHAVTLEC